MGEGLFSGAEYAAESGQKIFHSPREPVSRAWFRMSCLCLHHLGWESRNKEKAGSPVWSILFFFNLFKFQCWLLGTFDDCCSLNYADTLNWKCPFHTSYLWKGCCLCKKKNIAHYPDSSAWLSWKVENLLDHGHTQTHTRAEHRHSLFHVLHLTLHVVLLCSEKLNFVQQFAEVLLPNFGLLTLHNGYLKITHYCYCYCCCHWHFSFSFFNHWVKI